MEKVNGPQINDSVDKSDRKVSLILPFSLYKKLRILMVDRNYNSLNTVCRLLLEDAIKNKTLPSRRNGR